jgi:hypothetical protein
MKDSRGQRRNKNVGAAGAVDLEPHLTTVGGSWARARWAFMERRFRNGRPIRRVISTHGAMDIMGHGLGRRRLLDTSGSLPHELLVVVRGSLWGPRYAQTYVLNDFILDFASCICTHDLRLMSLVRLYLSRV